MDVHFFTGVFEFRKKIYYFCPVKVVYEYYGRVCRELTLSDLAARSALDWHYTIYTIAVV